jgi:hypothetical protein
MVLLVGAHRPPGFCLRDGYSMACEELNKGKHGPAASEVKDGAGYVKNHGAYA